MAIGDPNLLVLMRHRAVLFGIVGALLVAAAFRPALARRRARGGGSSACSSFVALAWWVGDANAELRRVAAVDLVLSAALACAASIRRRREACGLRPWPTAPRALEESRDVVR